MNARRVTLAVVLGLFACSTLESGTIALITGADDPFTEPVCTDGGDAFCGTPPNTIVFGEITVASADASAGETEPPPTTLSTGSYSGGSTVTLPQISSDNVDILQATVFDSADAAIILGRTLPVAVGGINGLTLDLFVQRKEQFATLPSPLPSTQEAPLATLFEGRYLMVASRSSEQAFLYDLLLWAVVENVDGGQSGTTLPCKPLSIAPIEGTSFMLILCAEGASSSPIGVPCAAGQNTNGDLVAFQYDLSGVSCTAQILAPSPHMWRSVAGGNTVIAPNGDAFIVGGTRPASLGGPTATVLRVGTAVASGDSGTTSAYTSFQSFSATRQGAAATWSTQYGLVVLGGNVAAGDHGVEYLGTAVASDAGATTSVPLNFPGDLAQGEGATSIDATRVLVAGGTLKGGHVPPVRLFDLGVCAAGMGSCQPMVGAGAGPQDGGSADAGRLEAGTAGLVPLLTAQGFAEPDASALFIGTEKDGFAHAFRVSTSTPGLGGGELPLRNPKRPGTTAVQTPIPSVVVVGGDTTMESYIP